MQHKNIIFILYYVRVYVNGQKSLVVEYIKSVSRIREMLKWLKC